MNGYTGKQKIRRKVISFQHKAQPLFKSDLKSHSKKNKGASSRRQNSKRNFIRISLDAQPKGNPSLFRTEDFGNSHRNKHFLGQESMFVQHKKPSKSPGSSRDIKNNYSSYNNSIGAVTLEIENLFQNSRRHIRKKSFQKELEKKILNPKLALTFHRELEQDELKKKISRAAKSKRPKNRKNQVESSLNRNIAKKKPRISRRNIVSQHNGKMDLFRSQNINNVKYKEQNKLSKHNSQEEINIIDCEMKNSKQKRQKKTKERERRTNNSRVPGRLEARKVFKKFKNIKREAAQGNQIKNVESKASRVRESRRAVKNREKHFETANLPLQFKNNNKKSQHNKRKNCSKAKYKTNENPKNDSKRGFACSVTGYQDKRDSRRKKHIVGSFSQIHNKKVEKSELFFQAFKKKKLTPKGKNIHQNVQKKLNSSAKINIQKMFKNPSGSKMKNRNQCILENSNRRKKNKTKFKISDKQNNPPKKIDQKYPRVATLQEGASQKPRTFHEEYSEYSGGKEGFSASEMDNSLEYGSNRKLTGADYSSETGLERRTANGRVGELFPVIKRVRMGDTSLNRKKYEKSIEKQFYLKRDRDKALERQNSVQNDDDRVITYQERFKILREGIQKADKRSKRKRFIINDKNEFLNKLKEKNNSKNKNNKNQKNDINGKKTEEKQHKNSVKDFQKTMNSHFELEKSENTEVDFFKMKEDKNILNDLSLHRSNLPSNFGSHPDVTSEPAIHSHLESNIDKILRGQNQTILGITSDIFVKSDYNSNLEIKAHSNIEIMRNIKHASQNSLLSQSKKSQQLGYADPSLNNKAKVVGHLYEKNHLKSSKTETINQHRKSGSGQKDLQNFALNQDPFQSPKAQLYTKQKAKSFIKSQYFSEKTPKSRSFMSKIESKRKEIADENNPTDAAIQQFSKMNGNFESAIDQLKIMVFEQTKKEIQNGKYNLKIEKKNPNIENIHKSVTSKQKLNPFNLNNKEKLSKTKYNNSPEKRKKYHTNSKTQQKIARNSTLPEKDPIMSMEYQQLKKFVKKNTIGSTRTDKTRSTAIQMDLQHEKSKRRPAKNLKDQENDLKWEKIKLKKEKIMRDRTRGRSRRSQMGVPLKMPSMRDRRNRLSRIYNWKGRDDHKDKKERKDFKSKKPNKNYPNKPNKNEPEIGSNKDMIDLGTGKGFFRKIARKDSKKPQRVRNLSKKIAQNDPGFKDQVLNTPEHNETKESQNSEVNMKKASRYRKKSGKERAFRVEKIIGQGSFANVYLVTSRETKQELVLKVTKSKNQEALKEQRLLNQINHPNILFSYGIVYPEDLDRFDFKNLEKFIPKQDNRSNMKSVDKLMKKNKYGELEFADLERGKQKLFKPIHKNDFLEGNQTRRGISRRKRMSKVSVSPNQIRKRMNFNFSKATKDVGTGKKSSPGHQKKVNSNLKNNACLVESQNFDKEIKNRGRTTQTKREKFRMKRNGLRSRNSKFGIDTKISKEIEKLKSNQISNQKIQDEYKRQPSRPRANVSRTQNNRKNNVSISRKPQKIQYIVYKKLRMWKLDLFEKLDPEAHIKLEKKKGRKLIFYPKNRDITVEMALEYKRVLQSGNFAMLIEHCGERTLEDLIRFKFKNGFGEKLAIRLFISLAKAVAHLHSLKIAHCDIKLENVLIDRELSKPKLIDFGLSVQNKALISDYCAGTPSYMSPQLLRKQPFNPFKSDVWALGVLFFKLMFGFLPYKGKTTDLILKRIDNLGLSFPKTIKISKSVQECISKMLRIQENQRPEIQELLYTHFPKLCPRESE